MVVLPHIVYFNSLLVWIAYLLSFLIDSMVLQNPEDYKFLLAQLSNDPIQFSQPLTYRQCLQDDEESFERHVQPRLDSYLQQLPLTSLQLDIRALIIVLKAKAMLMGGIKWCLKGVSKT